jgi:hypothetical protein
MTAMKQFLRDLESVIYNDALAVARVALQALRIVGKTLLLIPLLMFGLLVWYAMTESPNQAAVEHQRLVREEQIDTQKTQLREQLCLEAEACKKYSEARLDCATAGNFKTCLRIKMGEDSFYSDICSGYDLGAPAVPLPPETPTAFECFFVTLGHSLRSGND